MTDPFRELLAQLAAEHERLERECGALRVEVESLRVGQVTRASGDREEPFVSDRPPSIPTASVEDGCEIGEASMLLERRRTGSDTYPVLFASFGPESEERDIRASTGSKDSCTTLGSQEAEAEPPPKSACMAEELGGLITGGRGRVTFLEVTAPASPPRQCSHMTLTSSKGLQRSRSSTEPFDLKLWPFWVTEEDNDPHPVLLMSKTTVNLSMKKSRFEEAMRSDSCVQRMVMEPESRWRVCWDIVRLATLSYDVLMMPMLAFLVEEGEPPEKQVADLVTTLIWTIDIPITFFSGYHSEGVLEMRPGVIAKRYLQGWFLLDFPVVAIDWLATLLMHGSIGQVANIARMSKVLRICRALRLFRVLRVLKFARWADSIHHHLRSEASLTAFNILRSLSVIAVASHFVACGWYFVGGQDRPRTWVQALDDEDRDLPYRYATAMHWAVTQFTPASMEVVPKNTPERAYAIVVILAAVVGFSCFLSSITQAMANLQRASMENSKQRSTLRRYITQNRISLDLGNKIMRFLRTHHLMDKRRVHEDDVQVIKLLPETLRAQLHKEAYAPLVKQHPFFHRAAQMEVTLAQELCHLAVAEVSLGRSEELFRPGQEASCMFFMREGLWQYRRPGRKDGSPLDARGERWVLELALWLQWEVRGSLVAESPCEALSLARNRFQTIVGRLPLLLSSCRYYASQFHERLEHEVCLDDSVVELGLKTEDLQQLVLDNFTPDSTLTLSFRSLPLATKSPKGTVRRLFERDGGRKLVSPTSENALKVMRSVSM